MTTPEDLIDPDAPASEEEKKAAAELRDALADPRRAHEDADFARAVALAHAPREISPEENRGIVERALLGPAAGGPARGRVIRVVFGVGVSAVAIAAAFALLLSQPNEDVSPTPPGLGPAPLAQVRSTQPLFHEPFPSEGGESARIDRIALARAGDFRDNQFSRWGVR